MPRQARLDVPGELYHVMSRGIERRRVFLCARDYADFHFRASAWLRASGAKCLAWCLMPNHFHLLVLRGARPLAEMMRHVMTGYAVNFNLRYERAGHLFQNRYKAILCDRDAYLRRLAPYIHLNPVRAGLVKDLSGLTAYKWCGHAAAVSGRQDGILDREELLGNFGEAEPEAVRNYSAELEEQLRDAARGHSRAVVKNIGGKAASGPGGLPGYRGDERILGGADFIEKILRRAGLQERSCSRSRLEALAETEKITGVSRLAILQRGRERPAARARSVYCYLCARDCGSSGGDLAKELGVTSGAVSKMISKGRELVAGPN